MMIHLDPPALQGEFCPVSPSACAGIFTLICFSFSANSGTGQHWKDLDVFAFLLSLVSRKKNNPKGETKGESDFIWKAEREDS